MSAALLSFVTALSAPAAGLAGYLGTVSTGQTVTVSGSGFQPQSDVTLTFQSTPIFLKTVKADNSGNFSTQVVIPSGVSTGDHDIVATGVDPAGNALVEPTLVFVGTSVLGNEVTNGVSGTLPRTGDSTVGRDLAIAGIAVLVGGAVLVGKRPRVPRQ